MGDLAASRTFPVFDEESGAVYYRAQSENILSCLPLKQVGRLGRSSNGLMLVMQSTTARHQLMTAENFLINFTDDEKNEKRKKNFLRETAILQNCAHKNIIQLFYSVMGSRRGLILTEFCPSGALYTQGLRDEQVKRYFLNILDAVQYMHSKRIIHRDIRLDNILVKSDHVILSDFGLARKLPLGDGSSLVSGVVGSREFMAPEVYRADTSSVYDGFKADSYSMGVYLWCLLQRRDPPSNGHSVFGLWSLLLMSSRLDSMDSTLTECARQLLAESPGERTSVTSLYDRLTVCGYLDDQSPCRVVNQTVDTMEVQFESWETLGAEVVVG